MLKNLKCKPDAENNNWEWIEVILLVVLPCYLNRRVYVGNKPYVEACVMNVSVADFLFSLSSFPLGTALTHSM